MRDRAAAGADLHHLDHRNPQRQSRSFAEPPDPRDLEARAVCGLKSSIRQIFAVVPPMSNDSTFCQPALPRDRSPRRSRRPPARSPPGGSGSGTRSRSWSARRPTASGTPAPRRPDPRSPASSRAQVARHQRLHIGVGDGGGEALPLAHLRRHFGRQRHRHLRQRLRQRSRARAARARGLTKACRKPTAMLCTPGSRSTGSSARTAASSSGSSTLPSLSSRSGTARRRCRGTSGSGSVMFRSYWS